ncbi:hypothetical protein J3R30DRAFT_3412340 [Lentinula aciculospora]|uniref:Uncharacterized protein n=1 Tax=Lentinula aciculospora TaxID=153920 RepID=A0A9W8ZUH8_9AGAR|nr:hypothetical protein J3R30DRAFT_3412340 [Lentinula aciculospora]
MSSNPTSSPATRRRRAQIACRNCRKRKIKVDICTSRALSCLIMFLPRKGLVCEYVAVGEPSPPSTPALERAGYAYASGSQFPDSAYSTQPLLNNQMTGYPTYPNMGVTPNNPAQLNSLRFPSEPHSTQAGPTFNKYYPPDYLASSNSAPSSWNHGQDSMRSNTFDNRLQYYTSMANPQNATLYDSQSYDTMNVTVGASKLAADTQL